MASALTEASWPQASLKCNPGEGGGSLGTQEVWTARDKPQGTWVSRGQEAGRWFLAKSSHHCCTTIASGQLPPAGLMASPPPAHSPELSKSSKPHPSSAQGAEIFVLVEADGETKEP